MFLYQRPPFLFTNGEMRGVQFLESVLSILEGAACSGHAETFIEVTMEDLGRDSCDEELIKSISDFLQDIRIET